jgi:hypothetical protein
MGRPCYLGDTDGVQLSGLTNVTTYPAPIVDKNRGV